MRFRISWLWLLFLPLMMLSHMGKTLLFLFGILSIHEAAHMIAARFFHYPISSITIYPFGLCAQIDYIGMGRIWQELLIILVGPLTHLVIPYLLQLFCDMDLISVSYMEYLCALNTSILTFNLLPVFPLDGGRLMQACYHLLFRYTMAQRLTYISSMFHLFLLLYYRILNTYSAWLVMSFLLFQILFSWRQLACERMAFYHYRKAHPAKGMLRSNKSSDLYRAFTNMIQTKRGWMLEEDWLQVYIQEPDLGRSCHIIL